MSRSLSYRAYAFLKTFTFSDYAHFFVLVMLAFFHYTQASMDSNPQLVGVYALPQAETADAPFFTSCKRCYSSTLTRSTGQVFHYRPVILKATGIPATPPIPSKLSSASDPVFMTANRSRSRRASCRTSALQ